MSLLSKLNTLPEDLIIEILCKLKSTSLTIILSCKKLYFIHSGNKKWVTKNIVNSYNFIFTDLSNILFIKNKKVNADELMCAVRDGILENVKFLLSNGADIHAYSDEALRFTSMYVTQKL